MAKARKLKSGRWNVQIYDYTDEQGKKHVQSFTADTKAEALYLAAQYSKDKKAGRKKIDRSVTVEQAIKRYIELSALLSPSTLLGYKKILKTGFAGLMKEKVNDLDDETMQIYINSECSRPSERSPEKPISAKTVENEYRLIAAALRSVCGKTFSVKIPKTQDHIKELPDPQVVLNAIVGSSIELPCLLAMWLSFSMSEIRGLRCSDVSGGCITINRVMIDTEDGPTVKDNAKVSTRLRRHALPQRILDLIEQTDAWKRYTAEGVDGFLVPQTHNSIYRRWLTICKHNDIKMTFHDLRHMNASIMLALNVPDKYAMERGGWKTPHIMKSVYQHTFSAERERVDDAVNAYFDRLIAASGSEKTVDSAQIFCTDAENR